MGEDHVLDRNIMNDESKLHVACAMVIDFISKKKNKNKGKLAKVSLPTLFSKLEEDVSWSQDEYKVMHNKCSAILKVLQKCTRCGGQGYRNGKRNLAGKLLKIRYCSCFLGWYNNAKV